MKRPNELTAITRAALLAAEPCSVDQALFFNAEAQVWIDQDLQANKDALLKLESDVFNARQAAGDARDRVRTAQNSYREAVNYAAGRVPSNQSAWIENVPMPTDSQVENARVAVVLAEKTAADLEIVALAVADRRWPIMEQTEQLKADRLYCERRVVALASLTNAHAAPPIPDQRLTVEQATVAEIR